MPRSPGARESPGNASGPSWAFRLRLHNSGTEVSRKGSKETVAKRTKQANRSLSTTRAAGVWQLSSPRPSGRVLRRLGSDARLVTQCGGQLATARDPELSCGLHGGVEFGGGDAGPGHDRVDHRGGRTFAAA
jgi:hypothetical protein